MLSNPHWQRNVSLPPPHPPAPFHFLRQLRLKDHRYDSEEPEIQRERAVSGLRKQVRGIDRKYTGKEAHL